MKYLLTILCLLFLQNLSAQAQRLILSDQQRRERSVNSTTLRIKHVISIRVPTGKYVVDFVRPQKYHDYMFHTIYQQSIDGRMIFWYEQPAGFTYRMLWMQVSRDGFERWYRVIFKNNPKNN